MHSMLTTSSSLRHRVEPEGAHTGPQSMIPEETTDMPTSALANTSDHPYLMYVIHNVLQNVQSHHNTPNYNKININMCSHQKTVASLNHSNSGINY